MAPNEILRIFETATLFFRKRYLELCWGKYNIDDPVEAASIFLEGYAFEHQGRNPSFSPAAIEAIKMSEGAKDSDDFPLTVWANFCKLLNNKGLANKTNPLCHPLCHPMKSEKCIWCALDSKNIVLSSMQDLKAGQIQDARERLKKIRGVGNKIASLFLRDLAMRYNLDLKNTQDRWLLQPIDVWVSRIVQSLNDDSKMNNEKVAKWVVANSNEMGINPEQCNQGMWYFGARIAESDFKLHKSLQNIDYAKEIFEEHVAVLKTLATIDL